MTTVAKAYPYTEFEAKDAAPFVGAAAITKSDTNDIAYPTRGVYVGGGGDLAVIMADGSTATFTAVPTGTVLPIRITRLMSANTTATLCIALF